MAAAPEHEIILQVGFDSQGEDQPGDSEGWNSQAPDTQEEEDILDDDPNNLSDLFLSSGDRIPQPIPINLTANMEADDIGLQAQDLPEHPTALDFLSLIIPDETCQIISDETNRYYNVLICR